MAITMNVEFAKRQAAEATRLGQKLEALSRAVARMKIVKEFSVRFDDEPILDMANVRVCQDVLNFADFRTVLANYLTTEFHRAAKELQSLTFVEPKSESAADLPPTE